MTEESIYKTPESDLKTDDSTKAVKFTLKQLIPMWWAFTWRGMIILMGLSILFFGILNFLDLLEIGNKDKTIYLLIYSYAVMGITSLSTVYWVFKKTYGRYQLILEDKRN